MTKEKLFNEQNRLCDTRPIRVSIKDQIQELENQLQEFQNASEYINLEDCFDNIPIFDTYEGHYNISLFATNLLDVQILERLMELCYKHKNPLKVLSILENALNIKVKKSFRL